MSNLLTTPMNDDDKTLTSLEEGSTGTGATPAEGAADVLGGAGGGIAAGSARRKKMSRSSLLMLCVLTIAGGAIGGMRYLASGPRSSLAKQVKIDYDVENSKANANDHKKVLAELATTQAAQVPPSQVQRNPFMFAGALEETEIGGPKPGENDDTALDRKKKEELERKRREAEERQRSIETAFNELDLHSVMGGPTPVARISGQTVRVGDMIGSYFKVKAIEGRTVTLEADDQVFTLGMSQGAVAPTKSAPAPKKPR